MLKLPHAPGVAAAASSSRFAARSGFATLRGENHLNPDLIFQVTHNWRLHRTEAGPRESGHCPRTKAGATGKSITLHHGRGTSTTAAQSTMPTTAAAAE